VNATLNQEIGEWLTLSANARNALNWLYTSFAEYPMPGTSFTLSARVKFEGIGAKRAAAQPEETEGGYGE
jgi:hypothetical protein